MAKRVPQDEKPFRPVDEALVRTVMSGPSAATTTTEVGGEAQTAVLEPPPDPAEAPVVVAQPRVVPLRPATPVSIPTESMLEKRNREKRVLLTRSEERDIERLVSRVAGEIGTPVKLSHMLRASILLILHVEEELVERSRKVTLIRPGNGDAPRLAEFEKGLTQVLQTAVREALPYR